MKTKGKVQSPQSDFKVVSVSLGNGLARLNDLKQNHQLSEQQSKAVDDVISKVQTIQAATNECLEADSPAYTGSRSKAIGKTILQYDIMGMSFDEPYAAFGAAEPIAEREISRIDRDLAFQDMVTGFNGIDTEADYQGVSYAY